MSGTSPPLNHEIVRAGAGAGKTTALIRTVMEHVGKGRKEGRWPRLLVTTFTRKATQELRERLTAEACQTGDLELLDYCRSRSRLHISTIHGVLALFLRRYGHLLGIDPSYSILTEAGAHQLRRLTLRETLQAHPHGVKLLEAYSLPRLERLLSIYSELSSRKIAPKPVSREDMLALSAREAEALGDETLVLARSVLSVDNPKAKAYGEFLSQIAGALQKLDWSRLQDLYEEWPNKPPARGGNSSLGGMDDAVTENKKRVQGWIENEANNPEMAAVFAEFTAAFHPLAEQFVTKFRQAKSAQGVLEMSDLEEMTLFAIRNQSAVAGAFAADWDYWLVDEFQDTSPIQVELIERLSGGRPRFIVGDPQQSIYLFRGARMEVFAEEERAIRAGGGQHRELMRNYRSSPSLLAFLNDFLKTVGDGFLPLEPRTLEYQPQETVAYLYPALQTDSAIYREAEYLGIVAHVQQQLKRPGVALSDICILARKNRSLFEIAQFLKSWGIPTHVHASRGYFERREVQDALALLKFLVLPDDDRGLLNLLRSPWCRVTDEELVATLKRKDTSFWRQLRESPLKSHAVIQALEAFLVQAKVKGFAAAWEHALIQFGMFDFSSHNDETGRREANLWKLVSALALAERRPGFKILEFIQQGRMQQADTESADEGDAVTAVEPNVVNLMTVHAAKGLERRHVIIPHCDEGLRNQGAGDIGYLEESGLYSLSAPGRDGSLVSSPLARLQRDQRAQKDLAEQDRLLYVALTRAQESVFISWTGEPDKTSFAGRWRWPLGSPGIVSTEKYSVAVLDGTSHVAQRLQSAETSIAIRPKVAVETKGLVKPVISVVNLLEHSAPKLRAKEKVNVPEYVGRAVKGTSFHRLLEQARLNPQASLLDLAKLWFPTEHKPVGLALEFVTELESPPMKSLLESGHAEWGFQLATDQVVLEGQIDLWGEVDGVIWVIDYKSGNPEFAEKAFAQLAIYAHALRSFGHLSPMKLAVIYPFSSQVEIKDFQGGVEDLYPLLRRV